MLIGKQNKICRMHKRRQLGYAKLWRGRFAFPCGGWVEIDVPQELSAADIQRMTHEREQLSFQLKQTSKLKEAAEENVYQAEVSVAKKIEEVLSVNKSDDSHF